MLMLPVHISSEFRKLLVKEYPQLILVYVPASCTSAMQIADVAYHRPLKHAFSQHHMHSMIQATQRQLDEKVDP